MSEKDDITILWDMPIQTHREVKANRPEFVTRTKKEKENPLLIADMAISNDRNNSLKVTEKLYKENLKEDLKVREVKPATVTQQCLVYKYQCNV